MQIFLSPVIQPQTTRSVSKHTIVNPAFGRDTTVLQTKKQNIDNDIELKAQAFVKQHSPTISQFRAALKEAEWNSFCQGSEYVEPGQNKTNQQREADLYQDLTTYNDNTPAATELQELLKNKDKIRDRLLIRELIELRNQGLFGPNTDFEDYKQAEALNTKENALTKQTRHLIGIYNNYRAVVNGKPMSEADILDRLEKENDPIKHKELWFAWSSRSLTKTSPNGPTLAEALVDLVKKRNEVAQNKKDKNGKFYADYYSMQLDKVDIKEDMLMHLVEQMDEITRKPYEELNTWLKKDDLRERLQFNLEPYLTGKDPLQLIEATVNEMGDTLKPIFEKSVYTKNGEKRNAMYFDIEKDHGKSQHWYMFDVKPPDDLRIFGCIDPKHRIRMDDSVEALLHEGAGHGLDYANIDTKIPLQLRYHHPITTESHALLLENLMQDAKWLEKIVGIPKKEAKTLSEKAKIYYQAGQLFQIRNFIRMIQFERQMYKNPNQDLTKLWWDLRKQYLGIETSAEKSKIPSYANNLLFFSAPVYNQNYFLASLASIQKLDYIQKNFGSLFTKEAGDYLRRYRALGKSYDWEELIEQMTDKPLDVEALKRSFENFKPPTSNCPEEKIVLKSRTATAPVPTTTGDQKHNN